MRTISLHDTRTGRITEVRPREPGKIGIYVCGPTVYARIHIGNARPFVVFSLLRRFLRAEGYDAKLVINVTDVNDKIYAAAQAQGVPSADLAREMTAFYEADTDALGVGRPDVEPKAGETVDGMIDLISALIEGGHAYAAGGDVYFRVRTDGHYGELSHRDVDEMDQGEGVEGLHRKQDPLDFALWKATKPGEDTSWPSPWGEGRPGWHIECSAMAEALLGETIDIHGGGHDLIFPHHENEIAQSTCAHGGRTFARYWLHNGFLNIDSQKMSKSIGNVLLVHELLKSMPGEVIRLVLLTAHYRQPLDWNDEVVAEARKKLDRLYGALRELEDVEAAPGVTAPEAFVAALEDDVNTPMALAELFELARAANKAVDPAEKARIKAQMLDAGLLLGLLQQAPSAWFAQAPAAAGAPSADEIEALLAQRTAARQNKQWAESDRIRDELKARGVLVEDSKDGQRWRYA